MIAPVRTLQEKFISEPFLNELNSLSEIVQRRRCSQRYRARRICPFYSQVPHKMEARFQRHPGVSSIGSQFFYTCIIPIPWLANPGNSGMRPHVEGKNRQSLH